jgi:predicted HTH transcriptional regulator
LPVIAGIHHQAKASHILNFPLSIINLRRMTESQHTEYKQTWRDEYLKWISGFANAEGGVLVIGRDDENNEGVERKI